MQRGLSISSTPTAWIPAAGPTIVAMETPATDDYHLRRCARTVRRGRPCRVGLSLRLQLADDAPEEVAGLIDSQVPADVDRLAAYLDEQCGIILPSG